MLPSAIARSWVCFPKDAAQDAASDMQAAVLKAVQRRFIHDIDNQQPIGAPTP